MWRRVYYKVTQPELINLLDLVKTNTSRSYTLSSAKEKFGDDFVNKAQSDGFVDVKNESIGISVGDWSPTHEVLKLTNRSKSLARTHQENERSTELSSDAKRNVAIRVIGGLITAALLYVIGRMLGVSL